MPLRSLVPRAPGLSVLPRDGQHGMPTEGRGFLPPVSASILPLDFRDSVFRFGVRSRPRGRGARGGDRHGRLGVSAMRPCTHVRTFVHSLSTPQSALANVTCTALAGRGTSYDVNAVMTRFRSWVSSASWFDREFVRHGPSSDASAVGCIFCELGALKFLQALL